MQDVHEKVESIPVVLTTLGNNIIVPASPTGEFYIYIHEIIGSADAPVTLQILAGSRVLAEFDLAAGQGITEDDIPGHDGVPRFSCLPGEDFIINLSASVNFKGGCAHSRRY